MAIVVKLSHFTVDGRWLVDPAT